VGPYGGYGCAVLSAMNGMWHAAATGDVGEVERLVAQDPGLLNALYGPRGKTPLKIASMKGHVEVVRCLLEKGAAINHREPGDTVFWCACYKGRLPVVRLLMERGADTTLFSRGGVTPLIAASGGGHLEVVRVLLGHPDARTTLNVPDDDGKTGVEGLLPRSLGSRAGASLERGRPHDRRSLRHHPHGRCQERVLLYRRCPPGVRGCAGGEVLSFFCPPPSANQFMSAEASGVVTVMVAGGGASLPAVEGPAAGRCGCELRGAGVGGRDRRRGQAPACGGSAGGAEGSNGGRGQGGAAGRDGGGGEGGEEGRTRAALLDRAVHSLKPGVFEELMEMMG
jgi:hypothetical protein